MSEYVDFHFSQFLHVDHIICNMQSTTVEGAFRELLERVVKDYPEIIIDDVIKSLLDRESILSTVIAPEFAVPHARLESLSQMVIAFGTSHEGIDFSVPEMPPVKVIAIILSPKNQPSVYLQVLAGLAQSFQASSTIQELANCQTTEEIIKFCYQNHLKLATCIKAKNIVNKKCITLTESDSLRTAIQAFVSNNVYDIPLIDEEKDIRGVISIDDILKFALPDHLLWMKDLTPIQNFEPLGDILKNDIETKLADIVNSNYVSVDENVPAIELAKIFCTNKVRQIIITTNNKFLGVVTLKDILLQLFWA